MKFETELFNMLIFLLPSLLVASTSYLLIKKFLEKEQKLQMISSNLSIKKDLLPLRLQAYERFAIYLERISPNLLLIEKHEAGMNVLDFQRVLVATIRFEFEHNLAQQIYISPALWIIIRNTKEEVIRLINASASQIDPDQPAHLLSKVVFDKMLEKDEFITHKTLSLLKAEVAQLF